MPEYFETAIVRIRRPDKEIVGAGFLAATRQVVTCAHVVSRSFGLSKTPIERPMGNVLLDFPLVDTQPAFYAQIIEWESAKDIALLEIVGELPPPTRPVAVHQVDRIVSHEFQVYGFPEGRDYGLWSFGRIMGRNTKGFFQIESDTAHVVNRGFSGSLVWDADFRQIVGIITEVDIEVMETRTAYFIPINAILDRFPYLVAVGQPESEGSGVRYSCFISYPNDVGKQGELVRKFTDAIHTALSEQLDSMLDKPIYYDREHINGDDDLAQAICESACFLMIFTPKYFNPRLSLCSREFKAMQAIEATRLEKTGNTLDKLSFIVSVRPFSREVLPVKIIGQRADFDFRDAVLLDDLSSHPRYGPLIKDLAEHIFSCYQAIESCDEVLAGECAASELPGTDQILDLLTGASVRRYPKFPTR